MLFKIILPTNIPIKADMHEAKDKNNISKSNIVLWKLFEKPRKRERIEKWIPNACNNFYFLKFNDWK